MLKTVGSGAPAFAVGEVGLGRETRILPQRGRSMMEASLGQDCIVTLS